MLKAKFEMSVERTEKMIAAHHARTDKHDVFLVEAVKYNEKQTIVIGKANPIMYLIGEVAGHGDECLLDVSAL